MSQDPEVAAMKAVAEALGSIAEDKAMVARVLNWANARFGFAVLTASARPPSSATSDPNMNTRVPSAVAPTNGEIPGIAKQLDSGELRITARDLKARNGLDAVERLAHLAVWAHEKLTGEPALSSRKGLVPVLKAWRVYDRNARRRLSELRGLIRDGDELSLDEHAKRQAETYVEEIRDPDSKGEWAPKDRGKRANKGTK